MLNVLIVVGTIAVFLAVAVPMIRGALIRKRTVDCARKIIKAADAFDFYAGAFGEYPKSQGDPQDMEEVMKTAFEACGVNWWSAATDLGGTWSWYHNERTASVVIAAPLALEPRMVLLDKMIDDGNLQTGLFQRFGPRYHYIIKESVL